MWESSESLIGENIKKWDQGVANNYIIWRIKVEKNCQISKKLLDKKFESKGPVRKGTWLKQLIVQKKRNTDDVRNHLNNFTDKLAEIKKMT